MFCSKIMRCPTCASLTTFFSSLSLSLAPFNLSRSKCILARLSCNKSLNPFTTNLCLSYTMTLVQTNYIRAVVAKTLRKNTRWHCTWASTSECDSAAIVCWLMEACSSVFRESTVSFCFLYSATALRTWWLFMAIQYNTFIPHIIMFWRLHNIPM